MALSKISKVLVPIDGSKSSMRAADAAIELAKRYSDDGEKAPIEVVALYVIDINPKLHLFGKYGFHYSEYADKAKEEARKATGEWFFEIRERAERHNLRFRSEVADNSAASIVGEIVKFAERENVDLIIIGTRGQSEFERLLLGSVTSGVTVYAPCSVMVVK
jgi:nucleotide-binding universal stress UspA family protein